MKYFYLLLLLVSNQLFAQKEADWWFFGRNASVHFTPAGVASYTDGALSTEEGCSVISDKTGKLLFYTDGITVWNANHKVMKNGDSLMGDPSSTQSSVAIPRPKHPGEYYLFTVAATAKSAGIRYSLVDTKLEAGLGAVVAASKNTALVTPVTEKMTAVRHRNGTDIWVIGHKWKSNEFIAFLVSESGVKVEPVISAVGKIHEGGDLNTQGYMKSNPDGTNLALALEESGDVEIFDFDNATGKVSKPISVVMPEGSYVYGIEFSPSGSFLYASAAGNGDIFQFNLQAGSDAKIQASQVLVGSSPNKEWIGALQLGNDGAIYFPIYNTSFLGKIETPNALGKACNVKMNAVALAGKESSLGLPTFTQSFFEESFSKSVTYFDGVKATKGEKLVIKNIQFDFAKSSLQATSYVELKKVVALLKKNPNYRIAIYGHTDNIGNKSANLVLSNNRALSVKNYLVSQGITEDRIEINGFGSSEPITSNSTDAGRAKNRRVEFVLL